MKEVRVEGNKVREMFRAGKSLSQEETQSIF